jgi:hypothetical protein
MCEAASSVERACLVSHPLDKAIERERVGEKCQVGREERPKGGDGHGVLRREFVKVASALRLLDKVVMLVQMYVGARRRIRLRIGTRGRWRSSRVAVARQEMMSSLV